MYKRQEHKQQTFRLAKKALARNKGQGWQLIDQPQRLKIDTLDALNLSLAHQLPILSGGIAKSKVIEDGEHKAFYSLVSHRLVQQLDQGTPVSESLEMILRHLNLSSERLQKLLESLLSSRAQWLEYIATDDAEKLIISLENATQNLIDDELVSIQDAIPLHVLV